MTPEERILLRKLAESATGGERRVAEGTCRGRPSCEVYRLFDDGNLSLLAESVPALADAMLFACARSAILSLLDDIDRLGGAPATCRPAPDAVRAGVPPTGQPSSTGSTSPTAQCGGEQSATCKPPALGGGS